MENKINQEIQSKRDAIAVCVASEGIPLIPVSREKRPLVEGGRNWSNASCDVMQVGEWLGKYQTGNLALITGKSSGLMVIDVDIRPTKNGLASYEQLLQDLGLNPNAAGTLTVLTGGGGRHHYFRLPVALEGVSRKSFGDAYPGVDLFCTPHMVILPGSIHASGELYRFANPAHEVNYPSFLEEAKELPRELVDFILRGSVGQGEASHLPYQGVIREGERNNELFNKLTSLANKGVPDTEIVFLAEAVNRSMISPPLEDNEVNGIVISVLEYRKSRTNLPEGDLLSYAEIHRRMRGTGLEHKFDYSQLPKFLIDFYEWSKDSTHAPDELTVVGMISVLAAALGKQVAVESPGGKTTYPNMWNCGIARSGAGKTTSLNISLDMLNEINVEQVNILLDEMSVYETQMKRLENATDEIIDLPERPKVRVPLLPAITSKERMYEVLAYGDGSGMISTSEEMSVILADINSERNATYKPLIISLYGGSKAAPQMDFKGSKDLPIISEPAVGMLGVSTLGSFFQHFSANDFYSGLLQRFCFVIGSDKPKLPMPPRRDPVVGDIFKSLIRRFFELSKELGREQTVYVLSDEACTYWCEIYGELDQEFGFVHDDAVLSCFSRLNDETVFKIATVFHCLGDPSERTISTVTLQQAIYLVQYFKYSLLYVLEQLLTNGMRVVANKIVTKLQAKSPEGLIYKKLKDKCGGHRSDLFDEALDWLNELGIVEIKEIPNRSNNDTVSKIVYLMLDSNR